MKFKEFLESRELAAAYRDKLKGVPQDPTHHPEGDVLIHSKLVRKAIPRAIEELKFAKMGPLQNVLKNIDFDITSEEKEILALSAWLHDIGKASATTIDGNPWQQGGSGRIQSIGHQDEEHFMPQIKDLEGLAPEKTKKLYLQNKELINWLIQHHMDFASGQGFSRKFVVDNFDGEQVKNTKKMKLLLILMWADKMGRRPEDTIQASVEKNASSLLKSSETARRRFANMQRQSVLFQGDPSEFAQMLRNKPMAMDQKERALRGKYPNLTNQEVANLLQER